MSPGLLLATHALYSLFIIVKRLIFLTRADLISNLPAL
jgi:hypothetical protein